MTDDSTSPHKTKLLHRAHLSFVVGAVIAAALFGATATHATNPDAGRWRAQGGELLFSGTHQFDRNYWTHQSVQGDLYWTDGEDQRRDRASHAWETEVRPAVEIDQGHFTIRGPGQIVAFVRQIVDTPKLVVATATLGGATATFEPATRPGEQLSGWVLAGRTYSFDVALEQAERFNPATGYRLYQAPQEIEFELWFFASPGGRVMDLEDGGNRSAGGLFGGSGTGPIGTVDSVQCARTRPGAPSGSFGTAISCGNQGLWLLDSRGIRIRQVKGGDDLSGGQIFETDAEAWARLSFDDNGTEAVLILRPGTRAGLRGGTEEQPAGVVLFEGRLLSARDLLGEPSLFRKPDARFEIETSNARVGSTTNSSDDDTSDSPSRKVAFEVAYDGTMKSTEVIAASGDGEIICKARPEAIREVYEGDRASMDGECRANFDFPTESEIGALNRLAGFESAGTAG
ncbi:MAG: hypothetical protein OES47_12180, partial [Acidobacteriota bacterium]|nr:hypothetical protein [Acidobacteriota bacterium]